MGNTLTFQWIHDEIMTAPLPPEPAPAPVAMRSFEPAERVQALRDAAAWCRRGAPGGVPRRLFSPTGACAIGYALLELHPYPGDWLARANGGQLSTAADVFTGDDYRDPRVVRAGTHIAEAANAFDSGLLDIAAMRLEGAADLIERAHAAPESRELTHADTRSTFELLQDYAAGQKLKVLDEEASAEFELSWEIKDTFEQHEALITPVEDDAYALA